MATTRQWAEYLNDPQALPIQVQRFVAKRNIADGASSNHLDVINDVLQVGRLPQYARPLWGFLAEKEVDVHATAPTSALQLNIGGVNFVKTFAGLNNGAWQLKIFDTEHVGDILDAAGPHAVEVKQTAANATPGGTGENPEITVVILYVIDRGGSDPD